MKAKLISNIIKLLIVAFVFYEYHFQSKMQNAPLSADNAKGLLFIDLHSSMTELLSITTQ